MYYVFSYYIALDRCVVGVNSSVDGERGFAKVVVMYLRVILGSDVGYSIDVIHSPEKFSAGARTREGSVLLQQNAG